LQAGKIRNDLLSERRFYFMDCGIVSYVAGTTPISNDTVAGILAENFVYSELYRLYKKHNLKGNKPCCSIYDNYELDFMLVDRNDRKYGIEVKSNKSNKTKSLKTYKNRAFTYSSQPRVG
jgi:predicted AAA+ superfamily ATPase